MKVTKQLELTVTVISTESNIPDNCLEDFQEWLIDKAKENGRGKHYDAYCIDETDIDVNVWYLVEFKTIKDENII